MTKGTCNFGDGEQKGEVVCTGAVVCELQVPAHHLAVRVSRRVREHTATFAVGIVVVVVVATGRGESRAPSACCAVALAPRSPIRGARLLDCLPQGRRRHAFCFWFCFRVFCEDRLWKYGQPEVLVFHQYSQEAKLEEWIPAWIVNSRRRETLRSHASSKLRVLFIFSVKLSQCTSIIP